MSRPRKKPDYDSAKDLNDLLDIVVEEYKKYEKLNGKWGTINAIAAALKVSPHKARKILITAGIRDGKEYYVKPICRTILSLYKEGNTIDEIMAATGLNRAVVCYYLPYTKGVYNAKELSLVAERIRRYRIRQARCREFMPHISNMERTETEEYLWDTIQYLEGCIFQTSGRGKRSGIDFRYAIKGGEMFVNRKEKSITRSTINLAFWKAMKIQSEEGCVSGPKRLGTFGASYLYSIFLRLGICTAEGGNE